METRIVIPCTREELAQVRAQAGAEGETVTAYARKRLGLAKPLVGRPKRKAPTLRPATEMPEQPISKHGHEIAKTPNVDPPKVPPVTFTGSQVVPTRGKRKGKDPK